MKNSTLINLVFILSATLRDQATQYEIAQQTKQRSTYYAVSELVNEVSAEIEYRRFGELVPSGD